MEEGDSGSILYACVNSNGNGHQQIEIQVRNVVCSYSLPMHVDLRSVAMNSKDVTYDRSRGVLFKQKRDPHCYVKVYGSGSVYIAGCSSEEECKRAARGIGRMVQRGMQKLDSTIRLRNFRISNMMSTCKLPFGVKIEELARKYPQAIYEPELTVGLAWKFENPKATLRIHTTGSITVTGTTSSSDLILAIEKIYPIVEEFKCPMRYNSETKAVAAAKRRQLAPNTSYGPIVKQPRKVMPMYDDPACSESFEANMDIDEEELENYYAENSC